MATPKLAQCHTLRGFKFLLDREHTVSQSILASVDPASSLVYSGLQVMQ